ncbi:hypothetical protein LWI28_005546 [Acer negundo]|uniref:Uncharacterized protein n=1 Tax=Acer negundo TaxID=4023 RepID=A0AAD5P0T3_ACENE|nr:hypothetical protein LWI28_005546 [Acer negundo]
MDVMDPENLGQPKVSSGGSNKTNGKRIRVEITNKKEDQSGRSPLRRRHRHHHHLTRNNGFSACQALFVATTLLVGLSSLNLHTISLCFAGLLAGSDCWVINQWRKRRTHFMLLERENLSAYTRFYTIAKIINLTGVWEWGQLKPCLFGLQQKVMVCQRRLRRTLPHTGIRILSVLPVPVTSKNIFLENSFLPHFRRHLDQLRFQELFNKSSQN